MRQDGRQSNHGWPPNPPVLDSGGMHVKVIQPTSVAQTRALQVLGAGLLAGVLGGLASHRLWMGVIFAAGGVLVTLTAIDYRCAALGSHDHPPKE
jgi:hypothetical protein